MKPPSELRYEDGTRTRIVERIVLDQRGEHLYGEFGVDARGRFIAYAPGQTPSFRRDTILHEVLHDAVHRAALKRKGIGKRTEELFIENVAPWLLDALRGNPKLVEYLMEGAE